MAKNPTPTTDLGDSLILDAEEVAAETKKSAADTLREEAGKLGSQAADRARGLANEGKERASGALDEVAKMLHSAAGDVDERLGADYGRYARSAADGVSGFADMLRGKEVDDIVADVTDLVKKSPVVAVGVAAALGFLVARVIKSGIDATADAGDSTEPKQ